MPVVVSSSLSIGFIRLCWEILKQKPWTLQHTTQYVRNYECNTWNLSFNFFTSNSQRWKNAISTVNFCALRIWHLLLQKYTVRQENPEYCSSFKNVSINPMPDLREHATHDYFFVNIHIYFFLCACLVIFFDFLQSDWLQQRAAFYDIVPVVQKSYFFSDKPRSEDNFQTRNTTQKV
jgi:hypothetical protein